MKKKIEKIDDNSKKLIELIKSSDVAFASLAFHY